MVRIFWNDEPNIFADMHFHPFCQRGATNSPHRTDESSTNGFKSLDNKTRTHVHGSVCTGSIVVAETDYFYRALLNNRDHLFTVGEMSNRPDTSAAFKLQTLARELVTALAL